MIDSAKSAATDPDSAAPAAGSATLASTVIDSLTFARGGDQIAGLVSLARLPRLVGDALAPEGGLAVELRGWRDEEGKSWLDLRIRGDMLTRCQRCLESLTLPLRIDSRLRLIAPGEAWPDDDLADDAADAIAADRAMDVLALVEDEVLLALPVAPLHARCALPAAVDRTGASPFAALAALAALKTH